MDAKLIDFLAGGRSREVTICGKPARLRILSAHEFLKASHESKELGGSSDAEAALISNAVLISKAACTAEGRLFSDGAEALRRLSAEELEGLTQLYRELSDSVDVSPKSEPDRIWEIKELLGESDYERLKWRVLRDFGALPTEGRVRDMTDADYLYCILNILLDAEEELDALCPACREEAIMNRCPGCGKPRPETNESFDLGRFEGLMKR